METQPKQIVGRAYDSVRDELTGVIIFIAIVWLVFILDIFFPVEKLGLVPRNVRGLPGILGMHFIHKDTQHILSNTFPLFVLLMLMAGSRAKTWEVVAGIIVGSGVLLWVFGAENTVYIGSSALVFGLIGFLVAAGIFEKRPIPLIISIVVGLMYGWTFLMGLLPLNKEVSEFSHFLGALTGVGLAFVMTWRPRARSLATKQSSLADRT